MKRRNDSVTNINDRIKVKLTKHGKSILNNYDHYNLSEVEYLNLPVSYSPHPADADGYYEFTLWEFMSIFGAHFYNGGPQLLEDNEIIFLPKTSQEYAQSLFDEWVTYAENHLNNHTWRFLGFTTWLGAIKNLPNYQIEEIIKLTLHTWGEVD